MMQVISNYLECKMSKRIEFLDLAKGICIVLVVVYHLTAYYGFHMPAADFFKAFRMPLYFFLSGLFFKTYSGFFDFLKRKVNKLLIPFLFWYLLCSVCITLIIYHVGGIVLENTGYTTLLKGLVAFIFYENFSNSAIWFLLCLFEVNIIFYIVLLLAERYFKTNVISICIISLFCGCLGVALGLLHVNLPMYIDSSMTALPFFVFGYIVNQYTPIISPNKFDKFNIPIAIAMFLVVYCLAGHYSLKFNRFDSIRTAILIYPCGFLGTMGVVLVAKALKRIPIISLWGRYSIMLLVTHKMLYQLFAPIGPIIGATIQWSYVINLILTFSSYFLLIPFMKKYMPHVTAQKDVIPIHS